MSRICSECRYAVLVDYGYSNYTVEGTNLYCAKKLHPNDGFDHWYGENKEVRFAENCSGYVSGAPVQVDVDHEAFNDMPGEELEIYQMVFGKPS